MYVSIVFSGGILQEYRICEIYEEWNCIEIIGNGELIKVSDFLNTLDESLKKNPDAAVRDQNGVLGDIVPSVAVTLAPARISNAHGSIYILCPNKTEREFVTMINDERLFGTGAGFLSGDKQKTIQEQYMKYLSPAVVEIFAVGERAYSFDDLLAEFPGLNREEDHTVYFKVVSDSPLNILKCRLPESMMTEHFGPETVRPKLEKLKCHFILDDTKIEPKMLSDLVGFEALKKLMWSDVSLRTIAPGQYNPEGLVSVYSRIGSNVVLVGMWAGGKLYRPEQRQIDIARMLGVMVLDKYE